jgi:uncharacterized protein (TIGR02246 family)
MLRSDERPQVPRGHQISADDEVAIRAIIRQIEHAWNSYDGDAFAAPFADNADYVVVDGMYIRGRDVIAEGHRQILTTVYAGSRNSGRIEDVRFLREDVAVAHARWHLIYYPDGKTEHQVRSMSTFVLTRDQGRWSVTAFQNTPIVQRDF